MKKLLFSLIILLLLASTIAINLVSCQEPPGGYTNEGPSLADPAPEKPFWSGDNILVIVAIAAVIIIIVYACIYIYANYFKGE